MGAVAFQAHKSEQAAGKGGRDDAIGWAMIPLIRQLLRGLRAGAKRFMASISGAPPQSPADTASNPLRSAKPLIYRSDFASVAELWLFGPCDNGARTSHRPSARSICRHSHRVSARPLINRIVCERTRLLVRA
jgi:hypothetical protein